MDRVAAGVRATYDSGRTRSVAWRLRQLQAMRRMIQDNRDEWIAAVMASTLRPHAEAVLGDVMVTQQEIDFMIANVASWAAPHEVSTPLPLIPASSRIEPQPFGVTLIIGPSNYPMMLVLCPLAGALAAGNAAVVKPSELCPEVADLMASLVKAYLDDAVQVVLGDEVVSRDLLDQRWDHIMFTGSERVGKIVAAAAARHLTPTTLELGGKCPVVVDRTAEPLRSIAYKLAWGRLFNGGQSCVAPEYVLVPRELTSALVEQLSLIIQRVHGNDPQSSAHFGRVSSCAAAKRIGSLLVGHGGTVAFGGNVDVAQRYVAPTVIVDPREDAAVMCEECFGPVLSIISIDSVDDAIAYVRRRTGTPLTMYGFTSDPAVERRLLDEIPSGNAMFNDVIAHFANPHLPFGGLGSSGHGTLHGKKYFDTCVQQRSIMTKSTSRASRLLDLQVVLRMPPYSPMYTNSLAWALTRFPAALPAYYGFKAALGLLVVVALGALRATGLHIVWLRAAAIAVLDAVGPA